MIPFASEYFRVVRGLKKPFLAIVNWRFLLHFYVIPKSTHFKKTSQKTAYMKYFCRKK